MYNFGIEKVCEAKLLIEKLKKEGEMAAVKASVEENAIQAPQNSPEPSLHETISPTPPTKTVDIDLAEVSRLVLCTVKFFSSLELLTI